MAEAAKEKADSLFRDKKYTDAAAAYGEAIALDDARPEGVDGFAFASGGAHAAFVAGCNGLFLGLTAGLRHSLRRTLRSLHIFCKF